MVGSADLEVVFVVVTIYFHPSVASGEGGLSF
jgi:hypothetical protein